MARSARIKTKRLDQIQCEFHSLLISCLKECAEGRWGLFGQHDHLSDADARWFLWPEANRLKQLAEEITAAHEAFGSRNEVCDRFLALCTQRGANILGEPKLAANFLAEIR